MIKFNKIFLCLVFLFGCDNQQKKSKLVNDKCKTIKSISLRDIYHNTYGTYTLQEISGENEIISDKKLVKIFYFTEDEKQLKSTPENILPDYEIRFNHDGSIINELHLFKKCKWFLEKKYKYNNKKQIIQEEFIVREHVKVFENGSYKIYPKLKRKNFNYTYNWRGDIVLKKQETELSNIKDETSIKIDYEFHSNGNVHKEKHVESGTFSQEKFVKTYTENGNVISLKRFNSNNVSYEEKREYDFNDNLVEKKIITDPFFGSSRTIFKYDDNNNLTDEIGLNGDGLLEKKTIFKYDELNKLVYEEFINKKGETIYKKNYYYNRKGLLSQIKETNNQSGLESITSFVYDGQNNWIEKSFSIDNKTINTTIREIQYYTSKKPDTSFYQKQDRLTNEKYIKDFEFDSLSNIYKNFKYAVSFKVPKSWEFDYGLTKNNFFRSYQKDSLYVISALAWDYNLDYDINDIYEIVSKESLKDTLITKWNSQDLSIEPYDINLNKVYFKNIQAIKLEQKYLRREEDFSFEITEWVYIYIRNSYRIQIGLSAPTVLIENNLVNLANFISEIQHLPLDGSI